MIEPIKLDPFGVLKTKIPTDLQNKLLKECFVAEKQNQEMITGISFKGAPKHYYVTETLQELSNYVFFCKKRI